MYLPISDRIKRCSHPHLKPWTFSMILYSRRSIGVRTFHKHLLAQQSRASAHLCTRTIANNRQSHISLLPHRCLTQYMPGSALTLRCVGVGDGLTLLRDRATASACAETRPEGLLVDCTKIAGLASRPPVACGERERPSWAIRLVSETPSSEPLSSASS